VPRVLKLIAEIELFLWYDFSTWAEELSDSWKIRKKFAKNVNMSFLRLTAMGT
jgi:hypothetical protein